MANTTSSARAQRKNRQKSNKKSNDLNLKKRDAIKLIVKVKNDFSKFFIQELNRENLLGACRMEDDQITTQEEKDDVLNALSYHFKGIPFITNGHFAKSSDAHYAAFVYITASPLVRKWAEGHLHPFGITLELDLEKYTTQILCSSIDDWFRINNLYQFKIK
jgi:hypothetical protein